MRNIIFVQPNQIGLDVLPIQWQKIAHSKRKRKRALPIGMFYLMVNIGMPIQYIDNYMSQLSNSELAKHCIDTVGPEGLVCFGGTCFEWLQAKQVANLVKQKMPQIKTIYGGPNAKARPNKHAKYFDHIFTCGEDFLKYMGMDDNLKIWPTMLDIKRRHPNIDLRYYAHNNIFSGHGCPFNCRFCASKYINNRQVYFRPVDNIITEIKQCGHKYIIFREDNFIINKDRLKLLCRELARLGVKWECQARVSSLDSKTIKLLKDSGCVLISCGFESACDATLKYIDKGHTVSDMNNVIELFRKHNMYYTGGFIVGLPNEGKQEVRTTIDFINKLRTDPLSRVPSKPVQFLGLPVSDLYFEVIKQDLVNYNWCDGELLLCDTGHIKFGDVERMIHEG